MALLLTAVGLGPLVALAVAAAMSDDQTLAGIARQPEPILLPVESTTSRQEVSATLVVDLVRRPPLIAPSWQGVVTRVAIESDRTIRDGDEIAELGGVARLAIRTQEPFFRPLQTGDSGPDVRELEAALGRRGLFGQAPDDRFTSATAAAVERLEIALGVRAPTGSFDPGLVVWLPEDEFRPTSVALQAGAPAPPPGEELANAAPTPLVGHLFDGSGQSLALDTTLQWVARLPDGTEVPVDAARAVISDESALDDVSAALDDVQAGERDEVPGSILRSDPLDVAVLLSEAETSLDVPTSAIVTGADGQFCVYEDRGDNFTSVHVSVRAGGFGTSAIYSVEGEISMGDRVVANPGPSLGAVECS